MSTYRVAGWAVGSSGQSKGRLQWPILAFSIIMKIMHNPIEFQVFGLSWKVIYKY